MSLLLYSILLISFSTALPLHDFPQIPSNVYDAADKLWKKYKETYGKSYDEIDDGIHKQAFLKNVLQIAKHNEEENSSFKAGLNGLSDMTEQEFARLNGFRHSNRTRSGAKRFTVPRFVEIPEEIDWRTEGLVTEVKNQGACGSCWAFSAVASLEGQHMKSEGNLLELSEQQLIDCSGGYGNRGCDGGTPDRAFAYIKDNKGIDTEETYPYEGDDDDCRFHSPSIGATISGYTDIDDNEDALKVAVATVGPISVAIQVIASFQSYKSGVYYDPECSSSPLMLNHAVTVVGYGNDEDGGDYWIVKNSWGGSWGEDGYIRMARNRDNHCGIALVTSYPNADGGRVRSTVDV